MNRRRRHTPGHSEPSLRKLVRLTLPAETHLKATIMLADLSWNTRHISLPKLLEALLDRELQVYEARNHSKKNGPTPD